MSLSKKQHIIQHGLVYVQVLKSICRLVDVELHLSSSSSKCTNISFLAVKLYENDIQKFVQFLQMCFKVKRLVPNNRFWYHQHLMHVINILHMYLINPFELPHSCLQMLKKVTEHIILNK